MKLLKTWQDSSHNTRQKPVCFKQRTVKMNKRTAVYLFDDLTALVFRYTLQKSLILPLSSNIFKNFILKDDVPDKQKLGRYSRQITLLKTEHGK